MPRWLPRVLTRIREFAAARRVFLTLKARRELAALPLALDEQDACDLLANLTAEDSAGRLVSVGTGEWMYVFKPSLAGAILYVKLILRIDCIVVSFHEDEGTDHEEDDA
jgi:DNA-binding MarR family transcriptional regulator